jgi:peptidoglycan/xylan/chitin deacetylase (PgdA/CDA1 family)
VDGNRSALINAGGFIGDLPWKAVGRTAAVLRGVLGSRHGKAIGILAYHRIVENVTRVPAPEHNVTPRRFRQQLEGLCSRGYEFWSIRQLLSASIKQEAVPSRVAAVTFDDGYESVYTNALPVLRELDIPATVFVSTAFLDKGEPFPFDDWGTEFHRQVPGSTYRPLTTQQCREMHADNLMEIGAHTHTHQDFRGRGDEFAADLKTSVEFVQDQFQVADVTFAFPYGCPYKGFAANDLVEAAKKVGVVCGLTTESIPVDLDRDPFYWGRFTAFPWDTDATLAAKLEGWYDWAPRLRRRVSGAVFGSVE